MANGQQKARKNVEAFEVWKVTQTESDFKRIIHKGQLKRAEIVKAIGCGSSALRQNPVLKSLILELEDDLRNKGVLPPLTEVAEKAKELPKQYDNTANRRARDAKRLSLLEAENVELKAKVSELEIKIQRYRELSQAMSEMGFMPR